MKNRVSFLFSAATLILLVFMGYACQDNGVIEPSQNSDFQNRLAKVVDNDEAVQTFQPNYSEGEAMSFMDTGMGKEIYPLRVGQAMNRVEKSLEIPNDSTATELEGTLYQKFEGTLFITGYMVDSTDSSTIVKTVNVKKPFTTEIYRKVILTKVDSTGNVLDDWKVTSVSLPQGGTANPSAKIVKITLTPENGDPIVIENPNSYFFDKGSWKGRDDDDDDDEDEFEEEDHRSGNVRIEFGMRHSAYLWFHGKQSVNVKVEVSSPNDSDFVTLTYGANNSGTFKSKYKFDLVSSGGGINVYEKTLRMHSHRGKAHVVINVLPNSAVFDDEAAVEEHTWGIPYLVK